MQRVCKRLQRATKVLPRRSASEGHVSPRPACRTWQASPSSPSDLTFPYWEPITLVTPTGACISDGTAGIADARYRELPNLDRISDLESASAPLRHMLPAPVPWNGASRCTPASINIGLVGALVFAVTETPTPESNDCLPPVLPRHDPEA